MPTKLILTYNNKKINAAPAPAATATNAAKAATAKAAVMTMNRNIRQPTSMRTIMKIPASSCAPCGN